MIMSELVSTFSGPAGSIITCMQLLMACTSYASETNPKTRAQYSKFSQATRDDAAATWPSKIAMMVIYTPAFVASTTILVLGMQGVQLPTDLIAVPLPSLASGLCSIHFAKRCLEVLFLHKYSGRTDRGTPLFISIYYTLVVVLVACAAGNGRGHGVTTNQLTTGTAMFVVGLAGNFYHHYLLAALRSASNSKKNNGKKHVAPRGGLFSHVAAPHYLFELVAWLGIAVVSNHLNVYLVFASMCSYLGGRSVAQNDYNHRNFAEKDWPLDRKNMVPFIF